jgi:Ca-activated chloride channel family protein
MSPSPFNFEHPMWLGALGLVPFILVLRTIVGKRLKRDHGRLERFADKHLLPYLVKKTDGGIQRLNRFFGLASLGWILGVLALAGPRWD